MMSADSTDSSRGYLNGGYGHESNFVAAGDIRRRLSESLKGENKSRKNLKRDPDDPSAAVLKEPWEAKVIIVCVCVSRTISKSENLTAAPETEVD